jgi:hypothetical protein
MLRESCHADLARTIAVLPNLRYVDLPEGLFMDDPSYLTLRLEVQARCLDLRKMTYMGGSERSLQQLASGTVWVNLEVLELVRINMDMTMLRQVLGCMGNLRALKVSETQAFTDEMLFWSDMLPPFPVLKELILTEVPNVTATGLKQWLLSPEVQKALKVLTLNGTGVKPWTLHEVVSCAPALKHLSMLEHVAATMSGAAGTHDVPALASTSLQTLHFEITASTGFSADTTTASYYGYLAGSLLAGGLPNLRAVYVRDPNFPDTLLGLPPPMPMFAEGAVRPHSSGSNSPFSSPRFQPASPKSLLSPLSPQYSGGSVASNPFQSPQHRRQPGSFSSNNPFRSGIPGHPLMPGGSIANLPHMLEVFTKGANDNLDWSFVKVSPGGTLPSALGAAPPAARPSSSYGLGADVMGGSAAGWSSGAGARRSVFIGGKAGAAGGFLEVPSSNGPDSGGSILAARRAGRNGPVEEDLWPRPRSSAGESKREKLDLWR